MMRVGATSLVLLAFVACSSPSVEPPTARQRTQEASKAPLPTRTPTREPSQDEYLIYARGAALRGFDLNSGAHVVLSKLPTLDVVLSPIAKQIAVVHDRDPGGDPEGYGDPEILVGRMGGQGLSPLGPGGSPRWSPDGTLLAATTDEGVSIYDIASGERHQVLQGPQWSFLGWTGQAVVAVGPDGAALGSIGQEPRYLGVPASDAWGVSPTEPILVTVDGPTATFVDFRSDRTVSTTLPSTLGDGAWAPDGSALAVVDVRRQGQLVLADPETGGTEVLQDGRKALGNVVWSSDGRRFAFVRVDPADRLTLQAVVCSVDLRCEPAFSWERGVVLIGIS